MFYGHKPLGDLAGLVQDGLPFWRDAEPAVASICRPGRSRDQQMHGDHRHAVADADYQRRAHEGGGPARTIHPALVLHATIDALVWKVYKLNQSSEGAASFTVLDR